ncbi:MAG: hypothetical protein E7233_09275 [Lachnospiraceae bacterium]|nr:hypothetical protein [Lachnospiraceae bacterium]
MYSSSVKYNMDREFIYENYASIRKENDPVYGVGSAEDVVITPVTYDELNYILNADGRHIFLFGGTWSEKTQEVIGRINCFAVKHGISCIYNFDFSADGEGEDTSIKADLREQESYDGPGKKTPKKCAPYNYEYGEIVSRNLTDLGSWTDDEIIYLDLYYDAVKVPLLHEPFLVLYDKDDPMGPIIYAVDPDRMTDDQIENLFSIAESYGGVTPYTHQDYMYDAFKINERGHAFKTEDAFKKGEQINITPVTLQELRWILSQEGSFMVLFAGAWCANSQACIATVNDYAVANDLRIYMIDIRIDGKYPIDFWGYPRARELRLNNPAFTKSYLDLWERCLPGAPILCKVSMDTPGKSFNPYIMDDEGNEHAVLNVDVPYLLAVNKDRLSGRGTRMPVLAACNHDGFELINCKNSFIYYKPNYRKYTAGVYFVVNAYCESLGIEPKDISINREAPLVDGEPVKNPNISGEVKYFKEHDWYKEMPLLKD